MEKRENNDFSLKKTLGATAREYRWTPGMFLEVIGVFYF